MIDFLIKVLTPKISPMVYVMMFVSVIIGFCFATGFLVENGESILFANGAVIPVDLWGALLFATASIAEIGMIVKRRSMMMAGGIGGFSLWLLATIDLSLSQHWYAIMVLSAFHMIFHAYVYLAASLGVLERTAVGVDRS